ncbi:MAG: chloride channel protein [Gemmatimonadota bacterium]
MEEFLSRARTAEYTFMVLVAVVVGLLGGLGAVVFRKMISLANWAAWGKQAFSVDLVQAHAWWWVLIMPGIGGLIVGLLIFYFAREAKGHGVPEVIEAVILKAGVIRPRLVVIKSLASAIAIGSGGSVGREGPIAQIGAAIASSLGQRLRVSSTQLRTLAAAGAGAGIAATFNAPLAGALFGVEIVLGDFAVSQFSSIVLASVSATVVSRHFLGNTPAFAVPAHNIVSVWEAIPFSLLGVIAAGVALLFMTTLYGLEDLFERFRIKPYLTTAIGGVMVGAIGIFFPRVLGLGYDVIETAVFGHLGLTMLLLLIPIKLLATSLTLGSGGSGGIFVPSLYLGAMTGGAVGSLAHLWFPGITGSPGAYALVGMGAVVAGATHAPLTAILIIFELTSDYKMILPLMAACMIATLITSRARQESIYTFKLIRQGVDVFQGQALNVLKGLCVRDVMTRDMVTVQESVPLGGLLSEVSTHTFPYVYVVNAEERFRGLIELPALRDAVLHGDALREILMAGELAREDVPTVTPDENLDAVSRIFVGRGLEELPVVDAEERLLGIVAGHHILDAYNRELMKRDMVMGIGGGVEASASHEIMLGDGYRMAQIAAPPGFVGNSLRELELRGRYGIAVLLIRRPAKTGAKQVFEVVPGPDTVIEENDDLVVVGTREALDELRGLALA